MNTDDAGVVALVVWAVLFILLYRNTSAYFLGFCGLLVLSLDVRALEYAPALWLPVELILGLVREFQEQQKRIIGRRKGS